MTSDLRHPGIKIPDKVELSVPEWIIGTYIFNKLLCWDNSLGCYDLEWQKVHAGSTPNSRHSLLLDFHTVFRASPPPLLSFLPLWPLTESSVNVNMKAFGRFVWEHLRKICKIFCPSDLGNLCPQSSKQGPICFFSVWWCRVGAVKLQQGGREGCFSVLCVCLF